MRIRMDLAYDGTDFHGWATQPGLRTVQGTLEAALATLLRVEAVSLACAGRTDTGVHARGQVTHFDIDQVHLSEAAGRTDGRVPEVLLPRLNGILPADIRVRRVVAAAGGFDARFSALWRRYCYRVADRADTVDPLARSHVLWWPRALDLDAMNQASEMLLGEHDFASFCRRREGATTIRTLLELAWARDYDGRVIATVKADAFCHSMVRSLVGCLLAVGEGRRPAAWAGEVLQARVRDPGVTVVHPHGLTLEEVCYPTDDQLATRAELTRSRRGP